MTATVKIRRGPAYDAAKHKRAIPAQGHVKEFPQLVDAASFATVTAMKILTQDPDAYSYLSKDDEVRWFFLEVESLDDNGVIAFMEWGIGDYDEKRRTKRALEREALRVANRGNNLKPLPADHVMVNGQLLRVDELDS